MTTALSGTSQDQSRAKLERLWLRKAQAALARYRLAEKEHYRTAEELALKLVAPSDGAFAAASARKVEAIALAEYEHVIRIYTDLVVNGKIPSPDDQGISESKMAGGR